MLYSSLLLLLVLMTVRIGKPEESDEDLIFSAIEPGKHNKHFNSMVNQIEQIKKRDKHDSLHQSNFYESILKDVSDNAMTKKFESINNLNDDGNHLLEKDINEMKGIDDITSSLKSLNQEQNYDSILQKSNYNSMPQKSNYNSISQKSNYNSMPQKSNYNSMPQKSNYKLSKEEQLELNERNTISLKNDKQMDERVSSNDRAINLKENEGKSIQNFVHLMNSFNDPFNSGQEGISALSKKECHFPSSNQNFYSGEILNQPKAGYFKAADKSTDLKHNYAFSEISQSNKHPHKVSYNHMKPPPSIFTLQKDHKAYSIIPYTDHQANSNNVDAYNITSLVSSLGAEIPRKYDFGKIETRQNYPDSESRLNYLKNRQRDNYTVLKNINIDPSDDINVNNSSNLNNPHNMCQLEYRNIVNDHFDANDKSNTKGTVKKNSIHQNSKLFIKSNDLSDQLINRYEPFKNEMNQKYLDLLHSSSNIESVNSVINQLKAFKNDNNDNLSDGFRSRVNFPSNSSRFKASNEKIYVPEYEKMNDLYSNDNSQSHLKDSSISSGTESRKEFDPVKGSEGRMSMYWSRLPLSSCLDHIFNSSEPLNVNQDTERKLYNNLNDGFVIIPLSRYMEMSEKGYLNNAENNRISTVDTSYSHFFKPVGNELCKNVGNDRMNLNNVALTDEKNIYPVSLTQDQAVESESGREQMEMATRSNNSTLMCIPPTNKWTMSSSLRPDLFLHRALLYT